MLFYFSIDRSGLMPSHDADPRVLVLPGLGLYLNFNQRLWWKITGNWRVVLAVIALGLCALYLGAATLLHRHWRSLPGNQVQWSDIAAAPFRWENFRIKRGDTAIAHAQILIAENNFADAYFELETGVQRSPGNLTGRLLLVDFIALWDPNRAQQLLTEAEQYSADQPSLARARFALFERHHARSAALDYAASLLDPTKQPAPPPAVRLLACTARAAIALEQDRPNDAVLALADLPASDGREDLRRALLLRVSALSRAGRTAEAWTEWQRVAAQFPQDQTISVLEAELALAAKDVDRVASVIRRLKGAQPESAEPHLFAFRAWHLLNRVTMRDAQEEEFLTYFIGNNEACQRYGNLLVELELQGPLLRLQNAAVRHGMNPFAYQVQTTDLALRRGDFDHAFRALQEWEWALSNVKVQQRGYPDFLRRLVRATVDGGSANTTLLVSHLNALRGQATQEHFLYALRTLRKSGKLSAAVEVAELGTRQLPFADVLLAQATELRAEYAALQAQQQLAEGDRREQLIGKLSDDTAFFQNLDQALAGGSYVRARTMIQEARVTRPTWLPQRERDLEFRRVQLAVLTEEAVDARQMLRRFFGLYRNEDDARLLLGFAQQLIAQKRESLARVVCAELVAARPSDPAVSSALTALGVDPRLTALTQSLEAALKLLDAELERRDPDSALQLLELARRSPAAWLSEAEIPFAVREFRARWLLGQKSAAMVVFRDLVIRPGAKRSAAFKLVRDFHAAGDRETAVFLANHILTLLPEDRPAVRLLQEVTAPALPVGR